MTLMVVDYFKILHTFIVKMMRFIMITFVYVHYILWSYSRLSDLFSSLFHFPALVYSPFPHGSFLFSCHTCMCVQSALCVWRKRTLCFLSRAYFI